MIKPIITEKSLAMAQKGWYTFATKEFHRKEHIVAMIKKTFQVDVVLIRSMIMHGKIRRAGKSMRRVQHASWKKAIVQLKKGQKLDVFEVTQTEKNS